MNKIVYLKEIDKSLYLNKITLKIQYWFKRVFNIIKKVKIENVEIWNLPINSDDNVKKIQKVFAKLLNSENVYVLSQNLENKKIYNVLNDKEIKYLKMEKIKKLLSIKILEYILSIQKREIQNTEVNILVRESSNINSYIIEEIAKNALNVKIISNNIYKFKKIEEKLYDEYGIAIQFSNSYKKSLSKSNIIINLDFDEIDLNEYLIYDRAIIINCINQKIKIKSKLFNGVVINSVNISFNQELKDKFKNLGLYNDFSCLVLLASVLEQENYKTDINNYLVKIKNLYGNNGQISKNELKLYLTKK